MKPLFTTFITDAPHPPGAPQEKGACQTAKVSLREIVAIGLALTIGGAVVAYMAQTFQGPFITKILTVACIGLATGSSIGLIHIEIQVSAQPPRPKPVTHTDEPTDVITDGCTQAMKVLALQKELQNGKLSITEREKKCKKIKDLFQAFESGEKYSQLLKMRLYIDRHGKEHTRNLHHLLYVDVDKTTRENICTYIKNNYMAAVKAKAHIKRFNLVFSDIDDTWFTYINDASIKINGLYPGCQTFFEELQNAQSIGTGTQLVFLTARGEVTKDHTLKKLMKCLPEGVEYDVLFGDQAAYRRSVFYYVPVIVKDYWKHHCNPLYPRRALDWAFQSTFRDWSDKVYTDFATNKTNAITQEHVLWPEADIFFAGDSGEGDAITMKDLNPAEGNEKRLKAGFLHLLSSDVKYTKVRPDPSTEAEALGDCGIITNRNYVDATHQCCIKGILDRGALSRVLNDAIEWWDKESGSETVNGINRFQTYYQTDHRGPAQEYRRELALSIIKAYYALNV